MGEMAIYAMTQSLSHAVGTKGLVVFIPKGWLGVNKILILAKASISRT